MVVELFGLNHSRCKHKNGIITVHQRKCLSPSLCLRTGLMMEDGCFLNVPRIACFEWKVMAFKLNTKSIIVTHNMELSVDCYILGGSACT